MSEENPRDAPAARMLYVARPPLPPRPDSERLTGHLGEGTVGESVGGTAAAPFGGGGGG